MRNPQTVIHNWRFFSGQWWRDGDNDDSNEHDDEGDAKKSKSQMQKQSETLQEKSVKRSETGQKSFQSHPKMVRHSYSVFGVNPRRHQHGCGWLGWCTTIVRQIQVDSEPMTIAATAIVMICDEGFTVCCRLFAFSESGEERSALNLHVFSWHENCGGKKKR